MANLSQMRRQRMLAFLSKMREQHKDDDEVLVAINEVENEITEKKYGLVWEEHSEEVEERMVEEVPVFTEVHDKEIALTDDGYNFLLEGDNLHSLHLLEKTHKEKIDVIYIDPPYNTGNGDFIYNDIIVGNEDGFRHSKWVSFMSERLKIAQRLLREDGLIFISIDDNEMAALKLLCDEIFGEDNCLSVHHIQVRYADKSLTDGKPVKPVMEYVLIYAKNTNECVLNLPREEYTEKAFCYSITELAEGKTIRNKDGSEMIVFKPGEWSIEKKDPEQGLLKETWISGTIYTKMSYGHVVRRYIEPRYEEDGLGCLYKVIGRGDDGLGYRYYVAPSRKTSNRCKMYSGMPLDRVKEIEAGGSFRDVPICNSMDFAPDFGNIVHEGGVSFNSGKKPVKMLKELINYHKNKNGIILDFFAGSGSTGHAVLDLNIEDGGNRKFILCTNNENNICEGVTYPRLQTVITGIRQDGSKYSDGIPANLKYYKTDYIPKKSDNLSADLIKHIDEMIQLEYHVKIDKDKYISILTDEDADELEKNWQNFPNIRAIYISRSVLLTGKQRELFETKDCFVIPDYYFREELRDAGEA